MSRPVTALLMGLVKAYRLLLSAHMGNACRFSPTCSQYALQALDMHGAGQGSYLTLKRLARCQPWCEGGHDPVPPQATRTTDTALAQAPSQQALFTGLFSSPTEKKST
jgi:uncharacterized protein